VVINKFVWHYDDLMAFPYAHLTPVLHCGMLRVARGCYMGTDEAEDRGMLTSKILVRLIFPESTVD